MKIINMQGKKIGRLFVKKYLGIDKHKRALWECLCDCGNIAVVSGINMRKGYTKSCGCYNKDMIAISLSKHNYSKERLYQVWRSMKSRCCLSSHKNYKYYGGRGIKVCDEWMSSFVSFKDWAIANGYDDSLTIDRINVNGNYEAHNCRWISQKKQALNTSRSIKITFKGKTMNLSQWADKLNIDRSTLRQRLNRGWSIEKAFIKPKNNR